MKLATIATTALTSLLFAGSAMASTHDAQAANIPTREYQTEVVSSQSTTGDAVHFASETVLSERDRTLLGQETVVAYNFGNDAPDAAIQSPGADYR